MPFFLPSWKDRFATWWRRARIYRSNEEGKEYPVEQVQEITSGT